MSEDVKKIAEELVIACKRAYTSTALLKYQ